VIKIMGFEKEKALFMFRDIDPLLLELNNMGFLNGHTPFSALLAFLSLLAAVLRGATHIALSNESSANDPTIPHTTINHQYSKSFGFERDFRQYCTQYLCSNINYFSLLRPLNELQIAKMFATIPESFHVFHSCNAASKSDTWCRKCAKCLFTFIILSPFLPLREVEKIFGANLLEDASLGPLLDQLTGADQEKPFECVGTVREVNAALQALGQVLTRDQWPLLLRCYIDAQEHTPFGISFDHLIHEVNPVNFVPVEWEKHLRKIVNGW
jgi:hypothetical protein